MSKIDYQALRAKAEKATCGEWSLEYGEGRFDGDDALIHREAAGYIPICRIEGAHPESGFDEEFQIEQQANAEFIAAANPATVVALLGELETAKKRIAELEAEPVSQTCKLNEPSGNSPVIPDGWVACSERMPDNDDFVYIWPRPDFGVELHVAQYGKFDKRDAGWYAQVYEQNYGIEYYPIKVTHWMALPEPPEQDGE